MDKTVIYGAEDDGSDPPNLQFRAITFDQFQRIPFDLNLAGSLVFSVSPFNPVGINTGIFDMVPAVGFTYMAGQNFDDTDPYWGALTFLSGNTFGNAADAVNVAPLIHDGTTHAPAAANAATLSYLASGDNSIIISGIQVTLNCVAAQPAPVVLTVTEDPAGTPNVIYTAKLTGLAGTTVQHVVSFNMRAFKGATIAVTAPAATNIVTLNAQANSTVGGNGLLGGNP